MTQQQYEKLSAPFRTPGRRRALIWLNRISSGSVYAAYILTCLYLLIQRDIRLVPMLLVCGIPFLLVTLVRARINAPRPYEVLDIVPLIPKNKKGQSFPSRHVFSAFVIAVASTLVSLPLAAFIGYTGLLLMLIRVIGGVHYPKDVLTGAFIGIVSGGAGVVIWRFVEGIL